MGMWEKSSPEQHRVDIGRKGANLQVSLNTVKCSCLQHLEYLIFTCFSCVHVGLLKDLPIHLTHACCMNIEPHFSPQHLTVEALPALPAPEGLSGGVIAGIVIGCVVGTSLIILVVVLVLCIVCCSVKKTKPTPAEVQAGQG